MTWEATWNDILGGGPPRWKITDTSVKENALAQITKHLPKESLRILCPLAGDDTFVHTAWQKGHDVTAIDLVPAAVAAMRKQFGSESRWTQQKAQDNGMVAWKHASERATLYQGNVLTDLPELKGAFDAVYDKDSFGALPKDMRSDYCERIAEYTKPGGILYVEVKLKDKGHPQREAGPPFSVDKDTLMERSNFGKYFEYVAGLGEVFPLPMANVSQTAHILRRLKR